MRKIHIFIYLVLISVIFVLYGKYNHLLGQHEIYEHSVFELVNERDELREELTNAEMNYCALSLVYYSELHDKHELSKCIEELSKERFEYTPLEFTLEDLQLLSSCASAEAGELNYESQKGVAKVVLNRVKSDKFPNNVKDVIYQEDQFQVVENGAINRSVSVKSLYNILDVLINGYDMPEDVLYFHADIGSRKNVYKVIEDTAFCIK